MNSIKTNLKNIINTLHNLTNKKKVAIGFFGITRSLKYTIDSIKTNIFDVLTKNNIDYDIFMHTYYLNSYSNKRARESITNKINNDEYKLLNPKYFHQDDQDKIKNKLNLSLYRTHKDPWNTKYESVDFYILGCYSKFILTEMIEKNALSSAMALAVMVETRSAVANAKVLNIFIFRSPVMTAGGSVPACGVCRMTNMEIR